MLRFARNARNSTTSRLFSTSLEGRKVMVANRGEIACRVFRTAKEMGMKTVSVHSEVDGMAQHVKQSDESVCIGPAASIKSYLVIDNILKAMKETGTEFVHPGYGFLSENSVFCEACEAAGIKFVGPNVRAIEAMGDKIMSKQIAIEAGINTIPGDQRTIKDAEEAVLVSNEVGYPVMVKASAGGGGKGMRIAWDDDEARDAFRLSTDEAIASFNDDRIFIEKFIERPHHIEIQLLADGPKFDNVVCFPERECSIQRRNQKVIEESPSTLLTDDTRREMARQAAQLARAVQYESAGTVEFLCDEKQNFYFLEMNTRLQVEHPITEAVTNVDLVKHMLEVANGQPLPAELVAATKAHPCGVVPYKGHAIEARIYAEDPFRGFLPSTGPLLAYREPTTENVDEEGVSVRVDSGVVEGSDISMYYDPMISKLVTYAESRDLAITGMQKAIDEYIIRGVGHNAPFIADVCRNDFFKAGDTPTNFIDMHYPEGFSGVKLSEDENYALAASIACVQSARRSELESPGLAMAESTEIDYNDFYDEDEEEAREEEREKCVVVIGGSHGIPFSVASNMWGGDTIVQRLESKHGPAGEVKVLDVGGVAYDVTQPFASVEIDGTSRTVQLHLESKENTLTVQMSGSVAEVVIMSEKEHVLSKHMLEPPIVDTSSMILSPMPGKLISYAVSEGDSVELGQELCVVEAMKMQNILRSERKGVVKSINYKEGDSLKVDAVLLEFVEEEE